MYLSCHDNFTGRPLHRNTNRTKSADQLQFRQARTQVQFNKIQRVQAFRMLALVAILSLVFVSGAIVHAYAANEPDVHLEQHSKSPSVVVYSGDTLWSIATEHASSRVDKRKYINKIMKINNLSSATIQEGQVLQLP